MTIMVMVVGALGGLTRTVQQGFEYSEGYGVATQHARVVLDRIAQNVCQATANDQFPGCIVVAETVNSYRYPDTLVLWRPSGSAANPTGLPLYCELLIYCPNPGSPSQFVEITAPSDTRTVPAVTDQAGWQSALATLKTASTTKITVLSPLLRTCSTATSGGSGSTTARGRTVRDPAAALGHRLGQLQGRQRNLDEPALGAGDLRIAGRLAASVGADGTAIRARRGLDRIECGGGPGDSLFRIGRVVLQPAAPMNCSRER